jgi:large subunit ribosomal protein L23
MKNLYDVIRRPLITEKSTTLKESQQTLVFEVHRDATKPEIKKAVEALFDTKVADVRVANVHGKVKRQGRYAGKRADWKKAFVVLKKGEKMVEFFEQA